MTPSERRERLVEWWCARWGRNTPVLTLCEIVDMSGLYQPRHPTDDGAQVNRCRRDLRVLEAAGKVRRVSTTCTLALMIRWEIVR